MKGKPTDYPQPDGGYIDNGSSGFAPRYWEEIVRHVFISSAAALIEEFHVDGLRVNLTQAIHRDNSLHSDGRPIGSANQFGIKMLREWSRTLRLIKPTVMLIAEDHTGWDAVTKLPDAGGLGFDATWFADFYHNLVGDSDMAGGKARLIKNAGINDEGPLDIEQFAGILYQSRFNKVVYNESHDEAGNAGGTERTIVCAVNGAPLVGLTRERKGFCSRDESKSVTLELNQRSFAYFNTSTQQWDALPDTYDILVGGFISGHAVEWLV
jgi:1,4-alpha-glucan branching enzyme